MLAYYVYVQGNKTRDLTYFVHPVKSIVVKAGETSRLSVSFDGQPIQSDITAVQVALWNRGRELIRKAHLLRPMLIEIDAGIPILEATIRKVSDEVVALELGESELANGRLRVSWEILEENDFGIIQLIFAGSPDTRIKATATIEGQREIQKFTSLGKIASPTAQYGTRLITKLNNYIQVLVLIVLAPVGMVLIGFLFYVTVVDWRSRSRLISVVEITLYSFAIPLLFYSWYLLLSLMTATMPFDF